MRLEMTKSVQASCRRPVHREPFDRMLIVQAQAERIPIVSIDAAFDSYGVTRIW
jgi:PIN domain nuclease of toxin-antitoxin system